MKFEGFDTLKYPTVSVKEGYKQWADSYEQSVQNEMDIRLLSRIRSIKWDKIDHALDFACGTGRIGNWLKEKGVKLIDGVDFTAEMLSKASKKGIYNLLLNRDVCNTFLQDKYYELTIQGLADEHLPEILPLYVEASRITKGEGFFVVICYHPFFLMNGLITHFHQDNGEPLAIESHVHLISDHVKAAIQSNFTLVEMDEGIVDEDWLKKKPKWEKYKNRPVSYAMVWQKKPI
jgi:SAM-dependent methyltransferase